MDHSSNKKSACWPKHGHQLALNLEVDTSGQMTKIKKQNYSISVDNKDSMVSLVIYVTNRIHVIMQIYA